MNILTPEELEEDKVVKPNQDSDFGSHTDNSNIVVSIKPASKLASGVSSFDKVSDDEDDNGPDGHSVLSIGRKEEVADSPVTAQELHESILEKDSEEKSIVVKDEEATILPVLEKKQEQIVPTGKQDVSLALGIKDEQLIRSKDVNLSIIPREEGSTSIPIKNVNTKETLDDREKVSEDKLQVGATIASRSDIGAFREELMKDSEVIDSGKSFKVNIPGNKQQVEGLSQFSKPNELNSNSQPGLLLHGADGNGGQRYFSSEQPKSPEQAGHRESSISPNDNPSTVGQAKPIDNPIVPLVNKDKEESEGRYGAIQIDGTYTPEQLKKIKSKKVATVLLTVSVILVLLGLGYIFGWKYIKELLSKL
ncbi:MAG: hypothetical protein Q7S37_04275 [bacterium]|nr:hypothetical protein [bacterium]